MTRYVSGKVIFTGHSLFFVPSRVIFRHRYVAFMLALFAVGSFTAEVSAQSTYPALKKLPMPEPAPLPPGTAFVLPRQVNGNATPDAPACAEWTRSAGPDESVVITGDNFSGYSGIMEAKDTRFAVYGANGFAPQPAIQRIDQDKAIITLDKAMEKWSMYLVWPGNQAGYGTPITLNRTDAWWIGPDKAVSGARTAVFGRNLAHDNGTSTSYVYIKPAGAAGRWAVVTSVNPYRVEFIVPADLANGDYEVWVHNGHGGEFGWSGPLQLQVYNGPQWADTAFNVRSFGATGNGITDDTEAMLAAITTAIHNTRNDTGSTVYLPAGTYLISNTLYLGSNIKIKGAGKNSTILKCAPGFSASSFGLLHAQALSTIEISDLTIAGNNNYRGNIESPLYFRGNTGLKFENIALQFQQYNVFDLNANRHVVMNNCDVTGKYSFLGTCSQLFIDHCNFNLTDDAEMALHSWGGQGISLTNSTCQDLDNSNPASANGWGQGRFFVGNGLWGSNRLTYIADNVTHDLTVRPLREDQNTGEQILWEGNLTYSMGSPSASTSTTITLKGYIASINELRYAVVVKGKGLGQSRRIISTAGETITVDEPWNVIPDQSSVVDIGSYVDRVAIYNNYLDGKSWASADSEHNASAGIEPFGGALNIVADHNTLHEVRTGISNWVVRVPGDEGIEPNFFNLFTNNTITGCRWAILNVDGNFNGRKTEGTGILGTIFRNNVSGNTNLAGIENNIGSPDYPIMDAIVYEHNVFNDVPAGLISPSGSIQNHLMYHNTFNRGAAMTVRPVMDLMPGLILRANAYHGFDNLYNPISPSTVMEAPVHVSRITAVVGGPKTTSVFTLYNTGAVPVKWSAATTALWLTLPEAAGTIPDENTPGTISLIADPTGLAAGSYSGDILFTSGSQTRVYTVALTVISCNADTGNLHELCKILPLTIRSLEANRQTRSSVMVSWEATRPYSIKGFVVERSTGNTSGFRQSGFVPLSPGSSDLTKYSWQDENSFTGTTYYRLKELKSDDSFTYSAIAAVNNLHQQDEINVHPDPSAKLLTLDISTDNNKFVTIQLFDRSGKLLKTYTGNVKKGNNSLPLQTPDLTRGIYLLRIGGDSIYGSTITFMY